MKNPSAIKVTTPTDTTILLEREFAAPRTLVWRAISEPELVKQWYGPCNYEMTVCTIDFRVGGTWRYVLRRPDGTEMGQSGEYQAIEKPERIDTTEGMDGFEGTIFVTYTLLERDGMTTLSCLSECHTKALRDMMAASGMEHGVADTWRKLEQLLPSVS